MNTNQLLSINHSALNGLQKKLDGTAFNIANVATTGFKKTNTSFSELLPDRISDKEVAQKAGLKMVANSRGMTVQAQTTDLRQGNMTQTGRDYDLAIEGQGFFGVRDATGQLYLTRAGDFQLDSKGTLVNKNGLTVEMTDQVTTPWPNGVPRIDGSGRVRIDKQYVGQIVLFAPQNENSLINCGQQLFQATGQVQNSLQDASVFGQIKTQTLETSNVAIADSMVDMMTTQRSYSLNLQALQTTDDLLAIINRMTD